MVCGSGRTSDNHGVTALTIAITTPRSPACKRGVAVNLAASLARHAASGSRVCLVDADPSARDVTTRLAVSGPYLEDFADQRVPDAIRLADALATLREPPLWVLPSAGGGVGATHRGMGNVLAPLREAFDVVICDVVGGPAGPGRVMSNRMAQLDWLLLAVTPELDAVERAVRYLDQFEEARARGHVAASVRIGVVTTGDESSNDVGALTVAALLGPSFLGSLRQLWGRALPNVGFGAALGIGELDDSAAALFEQLAGSVGGTGALVGASEPARSRAT